MSNQEPQDPRDTTEKSTVNKKRRIILGVGALAPVALTLVSPSVLGAAAECLSQQMSGNTSHQGAGSCTTGNSPTYWSNPLNAWPAGFTHHLNGTNCGADPYSGGSKFNDANAFPGGISTEMAAILCADLASKESHFVAALLNAQTSGYILTVTQVRGLWDGTCPFPPGYATVEAFLASTWA